MAERDESTVAAALEEMDLDSYSVDLWIEIVGSDVDGKSSADWGRRRKRRKETGVDGQAIDFSLTMVDTSVLRVITVPVNSTALAAISPFFFKLFSNGVKDSGKRHATLRIASSEEDALIELLRFMSNGKLATTEPALLVDILEAADKFGVVSCMKHCSQMLASLPMTPESALLYLDYSYSNSMAAASQPLTDAAKKFLSNKYNDLIKFQSEVMNITLAGIEAIISSNDLKVESEDAIFDFLLRWAHSQYPELEERREILSSHLLPLVRFHHMTSSKLLDILAGTDIDREQAIKFVVEAVTYKVDAKYLRGIAADTSGKFAERRYTHRPLKVHRKDDPLYPKCTAFWDLKREECTRLFETGSVRSQPLHLGGACFFLFARYDRVQQCFGFYWGVQEMSSVSMTVSYEIAARMVRTTGTNAPFEMFAVMFKDKYKYASTMVPACVGCDDLFMVPWSVLMAADSPFFINGVLQLRIILHVVTAASVMH